MNEHCLASLISVREEGVRSENIGARCSAISLILILIAAVARGPFFLSFFLPAVSSPSVVSPFTPSSSSFSLSASVFRPWWMFYSYYVFLASATARGTSFDLGPVKRNSQYLLLKIRTRLSSSDLINKKNEHLPILNMFL